jgi:hypothetical protein
VPGTVVVGVALDEVKLFGPVQLNVTPEVDELPVNVTTVFEQVNGPELIAVTLAGGLKFWLMVAERVLVQPLVGSVTVKTYSPCEATVTVMPVAVKLLGPDQLYVAPAVEELPVRSALGLEQVRVATLGLIATVAGGVTFCVIVVVAVELQPVVGSVTVKV